MASDNPPPTSFSASRKWGILFSVLLSTVSVIALVVMINYLAGRYLHAFRFNLSTRAEIQLSPQTVSLLKSLTNQVRAVIYYDKTDDLYGSVSALLKEYHYACPNLAVETVDYETDPGAAMKIKEAYHLASAEDKNMVIFDCKGRWKAVDGKTLGNYTLERVPDEKERKFRNKLTAFQGELRFSAALLSVTQPKPLKAYFLQLHGEHNPDSEEPTGYSSFSDVLHQNNVSFDRLSLTGTNAVPADCNLLIVAGPQTALGDEEQDKISQYLIHGGRLMVLFNDSTRNKNIGLEPVLAAWGVDVGHNIVQDPKHSKSANGLDIIVESFNHQHPLMNPMANGILQVFLARSIGKLEGARETADTPKVEELAWTGTPAYINGSPVPALQPVPLMAAVEKSGAKGVYNERGTTRILVTGDSMFLENRIIDSADNRTFAGCAINWLLDQTELLQGVGLHKVDEFKFQLTHSQMQSVEWLFLAGMPGAILLLGGLVWLRRRH